ncbi:MAG: DNA-directed RNA polymerase subunit omega [Clostridia bacterium]|nr:DNA-directed RNA polymerase subunit omega [Clostridia bacterium]
MMNHPPLKELINKAGCRYTLVCAVSNRARQLQDLPDKLGSAKPVSLAIEELYNDEIILTKRKEN